MILFGQLVMINFLIPFWPIYKIYLFFEIGLDMVDVRGDDDKVVSIGCKTDRIF